MNREDKLREELEDAWFALVMEKIVQQEGAELNELNEQLKKDPKYAVPEELTRQNLKIIQALARQEQRQKSGRRAGKIFVKVACVAAVISALMITTYAALPPSRKTAVLNLLVEVKDVSTRLVMEEVNKVEGKQPESSESESKVLLGYRLPEIPEEFVVTEDVRMSDFAWIEYSNNAGKSIRIQCAKDVSNAVDVDTENANKIPITIHGHEGFISEKEGITKVVWGDSATDTFILIEGVGIDVSYILEFAKEIRFIAE